MKNKLAIIGIILIFAAGLGVLSYPLISSAFNNYAARSQAEEYTKTVKLMPTKRQEELLQSAKKYNEALEITQRPRCLTLGGYTRIMKLSITFG